MNLNGSIIAIFAAVFVVVFLASDNLAIAMLAALLAALFARSRQTPSAQDCYPDLPAPQLVVTGKEDGTDVQGNLFTRYQLAVGNWSEFPDVLFAAAPDLPPCGLNTNSSRTWVGIYAGTGERLYGFCALSEASGLERLWFGVSGGTEPPDCVFIVLEDRRCNLSYKSNCAPTVGVRPLSSPVT